MIEWLPTASVEVVNVALPPDSAPVPICVPPLKNLTVPVGIPDPGATRLRVAVNVTDCPARDGFRELVTTVIVRA